MDWDESYQNNETPWDRGEPAPPLVEYLDSNSVVGRILVPGCGLGYDARLLASKGCDVLGVDLSETAINRARKFNIPDLGSVDYQVSDFLDAKSGLVESSFDYVFEHTCFCAIDPSQRLNYVESVHGLLKPGGHILAILFTNLVNPDGPPFPTSRIEVETLFGKCFETVRHWNPTRTYTGRENEESMCLMKKR